MSDQIDPEDLYKAAYRETQGQPVDAEPRAWDGYAHAIASNSELAGTEYNTNDLPVDAVARILHPNSTPMITFTKDGELIIGEPWSASDGAKLLLDSYGKQFATVLAEKDARIAELEAELEASRFAERNGKSLAEYSIHAIRELLKAHDVPVAAFIDDHVGNAIAQRDEARAECEGLRANAQFLLDRLSEYDPTDEKPYHHFFGHVEPAMARLRAALSQKETSDAT